MTALVSGWTERAFKEARTLTRNRGLWRELVKCSTVQKMHHHHLPHPTTTYDFNVEIFLTGKQQFMHIGAS